MPKSVQKTPRRTPRTRVHKEIEWLELPIFIHGITPDKDPATSRQEYHELLERVNRNLEQVHKSGFSMQEIFITWGVRAEPSQSRWDDVYLAQVERKLDGKVRKGMAGAYGGPLGLFGLLRNFLFYGVSDLFYYVSGDGELTLRKHVFSYTAHRIRQLDQGGNAHFSLTLFGHSAGSVIAHDLLFHLFTTRPHHNEGTAVFANMAMLRRMIEAGRLRIRHLYTFGSPISPLILRADSLIKKFRADVTLKPEDLGFRQADRLGNPRWVNFWSRHDLISYPVEFMYAPNGMVRDQEIRASLNPGAAHTGYWKSDEMAKAIAETF